MFSLRSSAEFCILSGPLGWSCDVNSAQMLYYYHYSTLLTSCLYKLFKYMLCTSTSRSIIFEANQEKSIWPVIIDELMGLMGLMMDSCHHFYSQLVLKSLHPTHKEGWQTSQMVSRCLWESSDDVLYDIKLWKIPKSMIVMNAGVLFS